MELKSVVKYLVVISAGVWVIHTWLVQSSRVTTSSMYPTIKVEDQCLIAKLPVSIHFLKKIFPGHRWIRRGDIVYLQSPDRVQQTYIKRCVGLPGDILEIRNKLLYINQYPVREGYIKLNDVKALLPAESVRDNFGPLYIPEDHYFLLGDNRDLSKDSRYWGIVHDNVIRGKVLMVISPLIHWRRF